MMSLHKDCVYGDTIEMRYHISPKTTAKLYHCILFSYAKVRLPRGF